MTDSIRRILVGVDARGLARDALVRAFELADRTGAELDLLHIVEAPLPRGPVVRKEEFAALNAAHFDEARKQVEQVVAEARQASGSSAHAVTSEVETTPGRAAEALLRRAEATGADLLVIGPHGERKRFDFGSTTRALLGHTKVPVWNQAGPPEPIQRVLVPVDFSDHSRTAVAVAASFARTLKVPLTLLHCYLPPSFAYDPVGGGAGPNYAVEADREAERGELERWIGSLGDVAADSVFRDGDPRISVGEEAREGDLIVMGSQGRTGFSRFFLGSVAYAVVRDSRGAVVVVPAPDA